MWKVLNKEVDLGEPTSFLDHVYLGCTQRQCQVSKDIVDNYRTMFESRISAGRIEKLPFPQNLRISSWSYDMAGHAKKCVERYCELANKTTQQLYKVSNPCIDDHHFKEEEMKSAGELSHVCSQIVLKCLYLARIGRPDILWSVNKLARSITKWTKACDKRLNRLISDIHHTCEYKQYCHVGNTAKQCRLGLFQDSDFAGVLEDSKSTSGGTLSIFGSHTFVPTSWMCKKQTAVSHSSTHENTLLEGNAHSVRYEEIIHDGSGQPDSANYQEEADSETFVMGSDAAEFVNKVKDQVRKRQKRMSNVADSGEEHSIIWGMCMAAATFMGKNFMDNENSIKNSTDLTLKKMFDISEKVVSEQEEINNVDKIYWKNHSWKQLSLIGDETVINLQRAKVYVFSDSVLCLGRVHQLPESNEAWKKRIEWIVTEKSDRDYDGINGEPTEFEWNIFPGFTTLQLCGKVTDLLSRLGEAPKTFTGRILFMSMFNDISCDKKDNEEECVANAKVVSILGIGQWSIVGPGSEKKCILWKRIAHEEFGIISRTRCCWNSQKVDVLFSVQQLHCPGVISKANDTENCRYILLRIIQQLRLFFASLFLPISSVFTEQLPTCVRNLNPIKIDRGNLMY